MQKQEALLQKIVLEFTPLEFETGASIVTIGAKQLLEFTPLEFETGYAKAKVCYGSGIRIYSVGV